MTSIKKPARKPAKKGKSSYKKPKKSYVAIDKSTIEYLSDFISFESHFVEHTSVEDLKKKILFEVGERSIMDLANSKEPEKLVQLFDELKSGIEAIDPSESDFTRLVLAQVGERTNNAEAGFAKAKNDIMEVWKVAFDPAAQDAYVPPAWIKEPLYAEKFMPFMDKEERYVYTGYKNQVVINSAVLDANSSSIIVTKKDIESLVNFDFKPDDESTKSIDDQKKSAFFAAMKGKKSLCSVFVPSVREMFFNADGSRWTPGESKRRRPTEEEMKAQGITSFESVTYISTPAWSISQFKENISESALNKYSELCIAREPKLGEIKESMIGQQGLIDIVQARINQHLSDHSIRQETSTRRNFYSVSLDKITVMEKERFVNPVLNYRTFMHELAHSTSHLLDRKLTINGEENQDYHYAIEEILAETASFLAVKNLESDLIKEFGELDSEWKQYFSDASAKSIDYLYSYASDSSFNQVMSEMFKPEDGVYKRLNEATKNIIQAQQVLFNGTVLGKEITSELRRSKAIENIQRNLPAKEKKESSLSL
ncbi:zincin-like metallopeptidase domain-containing protein [Vibrio splendidus]|nr:hypothetical protein [Vibrio splendidus]